MPACLVTGGAGFLGRALVRLLCQQADSGKVVETKDSKAPVFYDEIRVLDRMEFNFSDLSEKYHGKIKAKQGDICEVDKSPLLDYFKGVDTVFHLASVVDVGLTKNPALHKVNVEGTKKVIAACKAAGVKRLVYTSSMDVVFDGYSHNDATEETVGYPKNILVEYIATKIAAEKLVIAANSPELFTASIRPAHLYGANDPHAILEVIRAIKSGQLKFTLGNGSAVFDVVYVDNVAHAHILAARNLFPESAVCGQSYFICEDYHVNWWEWIRPYVQCAGLQLPKWYLPTTLLLVVAWFMELAHWLIDRLVNNSLVIRWVTHKRIHYEPLFHRYHIYVLCRDATFSHAKATRDFGYKPIVGRDEALKATLRWLQTVKL